MKLSNYEKINLVNKLFDHLERDVLSLYIHTYNQNHIDIHKTFLEEYNSINFREKTFQKMKKLKFSTPEKLKNIFQDTITEIENLKTDKVKYDLHSKILLNVSKSDLYNMINYSLEIIQLAHIYENRDMLKLNSSSYKMTQMVKSLHHIFIKNENPEIQHKPISLSYFNKSLEEREKDFPEVYQLLKETKSPSIRSSISASESTIEEWAKTVRLSASYALERIGLPLSALSCGGEIHFEHNHVKEDTKGILGSLNSFHVMKHNPIHTYIFCTSKKKNDIGLQETIQHEYFHALDQVSMRKIIKENPEYLTRFLHLNSEQLSIPSLRENLYDFASHVGSSNIGEPIPLPRSASETEAFQLLSRSREMAVSIHGYESTYDWHLESMKLGEETLNTIKYHLLSQILPRKQRDVLCLNTDSLNDILDDRQFNKAALAFMSYSTNPKKLKRSKFHEVFDNLYPIISKHSDEIISFYSKDKIKLSEKYIYNECKELFMCRLDDIVNEIDKLCMENSLSFDRLPLQEIKTLYEENHNIENIRYVGKNEHLVQAHITDVFSKNRYWSRHLEIVARVSERLQGTTHSTINGKSDSKLLNENIQVTLKTKINTLKFLHEGAKILGEKPLCLPEETKAIKESKLLTIKCTSEYLNINTIDNTKLNEDKKGKQELEQEFVGISLDRKKLKPSSTNTSEDNDISKEKYIIKNI